MPIQKKDGVKGLVLSGTAYLLLNRQMGKKVFYFRHTHIPGVPFVVKENKPVTAVKLLRHFINWGKGQKNVREVLVNVVTGLSDPVKMTKMYERLGMRHVGGSFSVWLGDTAQGRKTA